MNFKIKQHFPISSKTLYNSWLNSEEHSKMTGAKAEVSNQVEGTFTAWDGYISGTNKSLTEHKEIIQSWKTTDFKDDDHDSELILRFEDSEDGSVLIIIHNSIPEGQPDYEEGWRDYYFNPMLNYFS